MAERVALSAMQGDVLGAELDEVLGCQPAADTVCGSIRALGAGHMGDLGTVQALAANLSSTSRASASSSNRAELVEVEEAEGEET